MNKIYFAGSIRGGREDAQIYFQPIEHLGKHGKVLTEHLGDKSLTVAGEVKLKDGEIHDRDMAWIEEATHVVAEVTMASLGVGYEIGRVIEKNLSGNQKKILCLYRPSADKKLSAMLRGCKGLEIAEYSDLNTAIKEIDEWFNKN